MIGAVFVGKEVVAKYKKYLNPKNWREKVRETSMKNKNIAEEINLTLEELWILLETKERSYTNFNLNNQQYTLLTLIIRYPSSTPKELAEK